MKKKHLYSATPPLGFNPDDVTPPPIKTGPWPVNALAFDVSGRCNLSCRYCAESATQPRRHPMTIETLEAAWSFLFPNGKPRRGASIRLGSGEPLLALSLLQALWSLIETRSNPDARPDVFLTTNGTLISEQVCDWLMTTGWHVKISLDGPEAVHDQWRIRPNGQGTHAQVAQVAARLARQMPDRISVTAVLCRGADPQQVFDSIAQLGVPRIELVPVAHHDESVRPDMEDVERYGQFVQRYAHLHAENADPESLPTLVRFANRVSRVMGYNNSRIPCGAGRSFYGVGSDGDLYPCFRFIGVSDYHLGHVTTGVDAGAATRFREDAGRAFEMRTQCRECWAASLCGGPCFACSEMFGPGDGQPIDLHCAYTLADARAAVWLVNQLQAQNPERLLAFLPVEVAVK